MDEQLLSILVCPACHTPVERADSELLCRTCGRLYPIRGGIPIMLLEEARVWQDSADAQDSSPPTPEPPQEND